MKAVFLFLMASLVLSAVYVAAESGYTYVGTGCSKVWLNGTYGCSYGNSWLCADDKWYRNICNNGCNETSKACITTAAVKPYPSSTIESGYTYVGAGCSGAWANGTYGCYKDNGWACIGDKWYKNTCANGCDQSTNRCAAASSSGYAYTGFSGCSGKWANGTYTCFQGNSWLCGSDKWYKQVCKNGCDETNKKCASATGEAVSGIATSSTPLVFGNYKIYITDGVISWGGAGASANSLSSSWGKILIKDGAGNAVQTDILNLGKTATYTLNGISFSVKITDLGISSSDLTNPVWGKIVVSG